MLAKRRLGRTGFQVTELGFGAWAIGGRGYGDVERQQALAALEAYVAQGGNFIDTATRYGHSEDLIGDMLSEPGLRERLILASKAPQHDPEEIREAVEGSLRRLHTDYVDLYYLHSPPWDADTMNQVLDVYETLKEEGKIRAIGASIKGPRVTDEIVDLCRQYIRSGRVDVLQVIYSIFRQKNAEMLSEAMAQDVGIVGRTVLESGFLTAKYEPDHTFSEDDHRHRWGPDRLPTILTHAKVLEEVAVKPPFEELSQVAIRFALDQPGLSTLIVGAKSPAQVEENMAAAELPPLDQAFRQRLVRLYEPLNDFFNPS
jgi:aryl-alcohol dehydrogenase-like predicted oxidoreductase